MKIFSKIVLVLSICLSVMILLYIYEAKKSGETTTAVLVKGKSTEEFRKGPYLIYLGNSPNMTVLWQLHSSKNCTLEWGEDNSYSRANSETKEYGKDHQHAYTIEGLRPGVKYYYRISAGAEVKTGSFIAAPGDNAKKLKFFVYGDSRSNPRTHDAVAKSVISSYKADPEYQTFVLSTGDLVKFGAVESEWDDQLFNRNYENVLEMVANLLSFPALEIMNYYVWIIKIPI